MELNPNELQVDKFSKIKSESGISSSVDVLCTTNEGKKIAIEMQRQKTAYFLAREQAYMSKLISKQVKEGEGEKYNEKILDTYIIIIGKQNIFTGNTKLSNQKIYELDVKPVVIQCHC